MLKLILSFLLLLPSSPTAAAVLVSYSSSITQDSLDNLSESIARAARSLRADSERVVVVVLSSPGGDLQKAIRYAQQIGPEVAQSVGVRLDTRVNNGASCDSACTALFTMGAQRTAWRNSKFGFHSPQIESRLPAGMTRTYVLNYVRNLWIDAVARVDPGLAAQIESRRYLMRVDMHYLSGRAVSGGYVNDLR